MQRQTYAQQYQQTQVATVDRGRLLLLMFEGGLKFLKLTSEALEKKDWTKFAHFLSKSQAVIAELMNTLDHEEGKDLSRNLERLYDFMLHHLTDANMAKSRAKVDEVTRIFSIIAEAFKQVVEGGSGKRVDRRVSGTTTVASPAHAA